MLPLTATQNNTKLIKQKSLIHLRAWFVVWGENALMIACKHPWCRAEPILMQLTQIKGWPEYIWAQNLDFFLWLFLKPFSFHWHQSHTAVWHSAAHCSHPTHTGVLLAHSECCFVSLLSSFAYEQTVSVTKTMLFAVETDVLLLKWNCEEKNKEENQTAASAHFKPGALRFWAVGQKTAKSCWMETCRSATPRPHPLNLAGWFRNVGAAAWFPFIILFTGVFWGEDTWMPFPWAHSRKRRGLSNNINCQSSVSGKRTPLWYCLLVRALPPTHTPAHPPLLTNCRLDPFFSNTPVPLAKNTV